MTHQLRLHICIVVSFAPSLINFRGPLIRAAIERGHKVTACAPDFDPETLKAVQALGAEGVEIALSRRGLNLIADLRSKRQLQQLFRKIQPDVVLGFTIKPNVWASFAAAAEGLPSLSCVTGLGYAFSKEPGRSLAAKLAQRVARSLYKAAAHKNSLVIFQNPDDRDDFIAAGCLPDLGKTRLVNGSGVDLSHYAVTPLPAEPVFLMISRLLGEKGVREYAQAAIGLKTKMPEARFLLVGYMDPGLDGIAQGEVDHWTASGVEFVGPQSDVRPWITGSSIYVLPSYREGTPRSVLEAMAMGRPVITTDAPGCRETVEDGVNGYLVPVRDITTLQDRMTHLAQNSTLRQQMGAAGLSRAQEKYDVNKVNAAMLDLLSQGATATQKR